MSNFNLFKTVFGNVAVMAKAMDNNIDKFCHAVLANLKEHYDFDTLTEEGEFEEFKEKVLVKAFDVFADFKMKVKKPKVEEEEKAGPQCVCHIAKDRRAAHCPKG